MLVLAFVTFFHLCMQFIEQQLYDTRIPAHVETFGIMYQQHGFTSSSIARVPYGSTYVHSTSEHRGPGSCYSCQVLWHVDYLIKYHFVSPGKKIYPSIIIEFKGSAQRQFPGIIKIRQAPLLLPVAMSSNTIV